MCVWKGYRGRRGISLAIPFSLMELHHLASGDNYSRVPAAHNVCAFSLMCSSLVHPPSSPLTQFLFFWWHCFLRALLLITVSSSFTLSLFAPGLLHERFLPTVSLCLGLGLSLKYWVLLNWLVKISYMFSGFVPGPCWATVYPVESSFGSCTDPKVVLLWIRVRDYLACLITCNIFWALATC